MTGGVEKWWLKVGTLVFCWVCCRSVRRMGSEGKRYQHVPVADSGLQGTQVAPLVLCFSAKFRSTRRRAMDSLIGPVRLRRRNGFMMAKITTSRGMAREAIVLGARLSPKHLHSLSSPSVTPTKHQANFLSLRLFEEMESKFKNGNRRQSQSPFPDLISTLCIPIGCFTSYVCPELFLHVRSKSCWRTSPSHSFSSLFLSSQQNISIRLSNGSFSTGVQDPALSVHGFRLLHSLQT